MSRFRPSAPTNGCWLPLVLLFGAGHVGHALARALAPLPFRVRWVDERSDAFGEAPGGQVEQVVSADWEREIEAAPAGTACLVMTHTHALDSLITAAALERPDFAYVGLIGSLTKRRRFEHAFRDIGIPDERIAALVCPIGDRGVRDKRPEVIAALTAAELVEVLARWTAGTGAQRQPFASPFSPSGRRSAKRG
jgi:xanthine dehydrogenase accessory factor